MLIFVQKKSSKNIWQESKKVFTFATPNERRSPLKSAEVCRKGSSSFHLKKPSKKNLQKFFWQNEKKVLPLQPQTKQWRFKNAGFGRVRSKIFSAQKVVRTSSLKDWKKQAC